MPATVTVPLIVGRARWTTHQPYAKPPAISSARANPTPMRTRVRRGRALKNDTFRGAAGAAAASDGTPFGEGGGEAPFRVAPLLVARDLLAPPDPAGLPPFLDLADLPNRG